jgi:hypothetical protein
MSILRVQTIVTVRVRARVSSGGICGRQSGTGGGVFSEYFGFRSQLSLHRLLHTHHHPSPGAGTIGQIVAYVPSGLSLTAPQGKQLKNRRFQRVITSTRNSLREISISATSVKIVPYRRVTASCITTGQPGRVPSATFAFTCSRTRHNSFQITTARASLQSLTAVSKGMYIVQLQSLPEISLLSIIHNYTQ